MDYGDRVEVLRHDGWVSFLESRRESGRLVLFSTHGTTTLEAFAFQPDDCLAFGRSRRAYRTRCMLQQMRS